MQNSNGRCSAFVSSSPLVSDGGNDDDNDNDNGNTSFYVNIVRKASSAFSTLPPEDPDDMDSGSASCGGVTIVFLIACIILCLKLFTLPILKNLTSLTKQIRSSTMHPLTADPRIRMNAFSMHETFNAPTSASAIPRLPSATFSTSNQIHPSSNNTPRIHRSQANSNANLSAANNVEPEQQHIGAQTGGQHVYFLAIPPPPSYQESIHALPPSYENISNLP
uniref:Uncharacterized protein n=1 Tax=Panagrolaimus sp. ES5 TaxID=591445 RepID=A0AC34FKC3_9BILA